MKALILSAGESLRLKPLTDNKHKCLLDIYENTKIVDIELEALQKCGIKDIVIVIGFFGSKIKEHVEKNRCHNRSHTVDTSDRENRDRSSRDQTAHRPDHQ